MKPSVSVGVTAALALLCVSGVVAEEPDPCALLTPAEVEGLAGVKIGAAERVEDKLPVGPLKDQPRLSCIWRIGAGETDLKRTGNVTLSLISVASTEPGLAAAFRKERAASAQVAGLGMKEVTLGKASCTVMKAPDLKFVGTSTGCSVDAKGRVVSIEASGHPVTTKPETVKAVLETAAGRLP